MATAIGRVDGTLSREEIGKAISDGLAAEHLDGASVLAIVPDHTRTAPTDVVSPLVMEALPGRAAGVEVIIYAPHVTEVGYHVRDYFVRQWDSFCRYPWAVLARSTHVKGAGGLDDRTGVETPRVSVTLATGIQGERCRKINLGWRDPATVRLEDFRGREDEGVLCAPKAGERLYRLR